MNEASDLGATLRRQVCQQVIEYVNEDRRSTLKYKCECYTARQGVVPQRLVHEYPNRWAVQRR